MHRELIQSGVDAEEIEGRDATKDYSVADSADGIRFTSEVAGCKSSVTGPARVSAFGIRQAT